MTMRDVKIVASVGLLCLCLLAATSRKGSAFDETWGAPVGGLQMSLAAFEEAGPQLEVRFRNVGESDTLLSLGEMVGRDSRQFPTRVHFIFRDEAGKEFDLSIGHPRVAGWAGEYSVPLRAGSTYGLKFRLNQLWSRDIADAASPRLRPGRYRIYARFPGEGEKPRNWGETDVMSTNRWKGTLQSNLVTLESDSNVTFEGDSGATKNAPMSGSPMSLAVSGKAGQAALEVTFRNTVERDTFLILGMMLANGREQIPTQVRFFFTDAAGKKNEFRFHDGRAGVAGRVDGFRVPLRAGSTYSLRFKLDELWSSSARTFASKLKAGKYQVSARFNGVGEKPRDWGKKEIALMNYWKWPFQSNSVTLQR